MLLDKLLSNLDVDVEPFAMCLVSKGWRLRLPGPPEVLLHFVLKGNGAVLGPEDDPHPFSVSSFGVIPKGAVHALEPEGEVEHEESSPTPCQGALLPELIAGEPDDPYLVVACGLVKVRYGGSLSLFEHLHDVLTVEMSETPAAETAFRRILEEQSRETPEPGSKALTSALMSECLVMLFRRLSSSAPDQIPWLNALSDPRLACALEEIFQDPAADHTVESLAGAASMSRSAFAERFLATFGHTPMNLVTHVRMQRAASLLRKDAGLSIDEVAEKVGYSSRSHFSHVFKKHFGTAPGTLRSG